MVFWFIFDLKNCYEFIYFFLILLTSPHNFVIFNNKFTAFKVIKRVLNVENYNNIF